MPWEISLFIIGIAFLLLVIFAIPSLLQMRRTAKNVEITSQTLNQNLPGILTNLDEISSNLAQTSHSFRSQVEGLSGSMGRIQEMVDDVVNFEKTIRSELETPIVETLGTFSAIVKGVHVFLDTFRSRS